ncbi:MAG TPA: RsmD family RNA methyltransferase [Burkholderiaceae bacterium]|nr:RsmD family RNA methyltransferase [Burkholderiaceae bacterium]
MTARKPARGAPHHVRIIGGIWRRTRLPVADLPGLRPSPDRVRETLFNWLHHLRPDFSELAALDLFAGTGALGFECASRGARAVTLVESSAVALEQLHAVRTRLAARQVDIVAGDALAIAARLPRASFDLVFLDPPFDADLQDSALAAARLLLAPGGLLYLEGPTPLPDGAAQRHGLEVVRQGRASRVAFHLLRSASA